MALQKNESRRVSIDKVENGFIITLSVEKEKANGEFDFITQKFVTTSASDADKMMKDLVGKIDDNKKTTVSL